jgi:hypothetical protein
MPSLLLVVVAMRLPSIVEACRLPFTNSVTFHCSTELIHREATHQPNWVSNLCWAKRAKGTLGQQNRHRHATLGTQINASKARRLSDTVEFLFVSKSTIRPKEPRERLDDAAHHLGELWNGGTFGCTPGYSYGARSRIVNGEFRRDEPRFNRYTKEQSGGLDCDGVSRKLVSGG